MLGRVREISPTLLSADEPKRPPDRREERDRGRGEKKEGRIASAEGVGGARASGEG